VRKLKLVVVYTLVIIINIYINLGNTNVYAEKLKLTDVKDGDWFKSNVEFLIDKGIVNGYADGTFKPSDTVTKAQFVKMIITSIGYTDIPSGSNYWAAPYVEKAMTLEILSPRIVTKDEFEQPISRADMALIISKALREDYVKNIEDYAKLLKDYASINDIYKEYVLKAYSKGILGGYSDGEFKATNSLTRAEASTVIVRMLNKNVRIKVKVEFTDEDTARLKGYEFSSGQALSFEQTTSTLGTFYSLVYENQAKDYLEHVLYGVDYTKLQVDEIPWRLAYLAAKAEENKEEEDKIIKYIIDNQIINEAKFITSDKFMYKSTTGNIMVRGMLEYKYVSTLEENITKNTLIRKDVEVEITATPNQPIIVKNIKYLN